MLVVESVVSASVLTAPSLQAVNSPSAPEAVAPKALRVTATAKGGVTAVLPPHSFAVMTLAVAN